MHCGVLVVALILFPCLMASKVTQSNVKKWCSSVPGLNSAQIKMCRNDKTIRPAIKLGLETAVKMCESEFRNGRWNCQMLGSPSLLRRAPEGSREAAFVTALTAAALALRISSACAPDKKDSPVPCPCKLNGPSYSAQCRSKQAHAATKFTVGFLSLTYETSNPLYHMNLHNIRTGLKVLKHVNPTHCGQGRHSKTGRCSSPLLKVISAKLKVKYTSARAILPPDRSAADGSVFQLKDKQQVKKNELVFMKQSPDYCKRDRLAGIPGTRDRTCDARLPSREGGCAALCCGRDYYVFSYKQSRPCKCEFNKCKDCKPPEKFRMVCKRCEVSVFEARCN